MTPAPGLAERRALQSLLAFWAEAGVDAAYVDEPVDRLAPILRSRPVQASSSQAPSLQAAAASPAGRPATHAGEAAALLASQAAGQADSLEALAAAVARFQGCALRRPGADRAVFARGPADAVLVVIGDAPSTEDEAAGEPFRGRAGRLLDRMLAAAGLGERALLLNTVFWRTPGGAAPSPEDQAACAPFVSRALELVQPRAVLVLGSAAARGVLGRSEPILTLRGRWIEPSSAPGAPTAPAMPTLSPAVLLAQPMAKKHAWRDLLSVAARVDSLTAPR